MRWSFLPVFLSDFDFRVVGFLSPGSRGSLSSGFAGFCLQEAMYSSESLSPALLDLRISSSLSDCLSFWFSDDSPSQSFWFLHLQTYLYLQRSWIYTCKIVEEVGSIVGVDDLFPIRKSTSFGSSVRALVKIGSSVVRLRRRRSSVVFFSGSGGRKRLFVLIRVHWSPGDRTCGRWRAMACFLNGLFLVGWNPQVVNLFGPVFWAFVVMFVGLFLPSLSCFVMGFALLSRVPLIKFPVKKKTF